jgi:hypothetical protein
MSIANVLKSSLVILLGTTSGYTLMKYSQENLSPSPNRFIASSVIGKMGKEQVARQFFDLQAESQIAKDESSVTELKIVFTAVKDLNAGLNYSWSLPDGVNILQGPVQDQLPAFKAGDTRDIVLKVTGFSKELKKYVSFKIDGSANQFPVRREVLISSRIEDSIDYLVQQSELKKLNSGQANKLGSAKSKFSQENVIR